MNSIKNFALAGIFGLGVFSNIARTEVSQNLTGTRDRLEAKTEMRLENRMDKTEIRQELSNRFKDSKAVLKSVKITSVGTGSITVDNGGTSVVVNIGSKTQLRRHYWGKSNLSEFSVGNIVSVIGRYADDTKTVVNAVLIRNESIQRRHGVFFGTVKSLTPTGFVMTTISRDEQTVTVTGAKLINRRGETIGVTDIVVGHRVRVRGLWDKSLKTVTELKEVKDFSLPPRASRSPKGSFEPSNTPKASALPTASPTTSPSGTPSPTAV